MRHRAVAVFALCAVLAVTLAGCESAPVPSPAVATPTAPSALSPDANAGAEAASPAPSLPPTPGATDPATAYPGATAGGTGAASWRADGQFGADEYTHQQSVGDMDVRWANDAEYLYVGIQAPTTGWVAVGLDPTNRMQGANLIMGAVVDGQPTFWDAVGMAPIGPNHPQDTKVGGSMDILASAAGEQDGHTAIEFQIPLDSGDQYDRPLKPGQAYPAIVAFGKSDNFSSIHSFHGSFDLQLDAAP